MNCPGLFPRWVNPRLNDFEDKEIVFRHQVHIHNLAFQAGVTFGNERGFDEFGGQGSESKLLELIHTATRSVPTNHNGLGQFHVAAPLAQLGSGIDFHSPEGVMFRHLFSHQDLTANSPLWKGALLCLAEAWPGSIPISKLASLARVRAGLQKPVDGESLLDDERLVGKSILDLYLCGFAEIHSTPSRFCTQLTARPHASPLARLQAASGNRLTNLRHEVVVVDNLGRYLLPYLDGSHDHGALTSILERGVEDGLLAVAETGQPCDSKQDLKIQFAKVLDRTLQGLALAALLSG